MNHPGGHDFAIILADCTGEERQHMTMVSFMMELEELVKRYDFKLRTWGDRSAVRRTMADEQARLDRDDTAAMLAEFRTARDIRESAEDMAS